MPLSKQEIEELFEKAESYMELRRKAIGDDTHYLEQALKCYDQIIENAPLHPHYFEKRAEIKRMLAHRSIYYNFDSAIEDIDIDLY